MADFGRVSRRGSLSVHDLTLATPGTPCPFFNGPNDAVLLSKACRFRVHGAVLRHTIRIR